jgi:hypothetical protein
MGVLQLPTGFQIGDFVGHEWTRRLTVSREQYPDGSEFCVCWVGSFWLLTDRSGGQSGEGDGVAVGFAPSGEVWSNPAWEQRLDGFDALSEGSNPLSKAVLLAPVIATFATMLLPVVDEGFAIGADLEWTLEAAQASSQFDSLMGAVMCLALTALWRAEEERRERVSDT